MSVSGLLLFYCCNLTIALFALYLLLQTVFSAPFVPTRTKAAAEVLAKYLKPGMRFVDLGCGDGRIVFAAARLGADAYGVETNPVLFVFLQLRRLVSRQDNVHFIYKSLFREDLSKYDVIYAYLMPRLMLKLQHKLEAQMQPGAVLVTNSFSLPGWTPTEVNRQHFYVYSQIRSY